MGKFAPNKFKNDNYKIMNEALRTKLSDSAAARWTALAIVSVTMMFAYFFTDVMSPLEPLLTAPVTEGGLGWSSSEYGFFSGSYGFFNVFLLLLFFGGIILDKFGIRFAGIMSTVLMFAGALIKWYAVGNAFDGTVTLPFGLGTYGTQVIIACLGFATFGVGSEIAGITVSKVIVKWFTGHELALAMGLQVALARIGTAVALAASLPFAKAWGAASASVGLGAALLLIGAVSFLVYCVMDKKEDAAAAMTQSEPEEGFKMSDLGVLFTNKGFWCITLLCLMFYSGVFPFLKFATKIMVFKYEVSEDMAGLIPALLPFGTIFLTPFFGNVYDRYGKGATLMLIGSILLTLVHVSFALPMNSWIVPILAMIVLGIAFGLVPSAMWPSVPKIIPMKLLGTAYAVIFYIQNIGLSMVPILIGNVNNKNTAADGFIDYTESMTIFAGFGVVAIVIALLLLLEDKKKGYGLQQPNVKK
jgi:predicted MFS family arabinose efflux permease